MIDSSSDLQRLVSSPVFSAEDQSRSIVALIGKAGISGLVGNFLKVVARNRRLFAVPAIIKSYHETVARERGEVAADVKTAHALSAAQQKELKAALASVTRENRDAQCHSRCIAAGRSDRQDRLAPGRLIASH
jgi:F-type H+-transporting ATPase subunit delta